jgi:hypothetical protein
VTVVPHVGVSRPTACRSGGDVMHTGLEWLPCPNAANEWGRGWFETVPGWCCPLGRTAHTVQPAKKCFSNFPNYNKFVKYKMPSSGAPKFS